MGSSEEIKRLIDAVDDTGDDQKKILIEKYFEGFTGWDDESQNGYEFLQKELQRHVDEKNYLHACNLSMMLYQLDKKAKGGGR